MDDVSSGIFIVWAYTLEQTLYSLIMYLWPNVFPD